MRNLRGIVSLAVPRLPSEHFSIPLLSILAGLLAAFLHLHVFSSLSAAELKLEAGYDTNPLEVQSASEAQPYLRLYLRSPVVLHERPSHRVQLDYQSGFTRWVTQASMLHQASVRWESRLPASLYLQTFSGMQHRSLFQIAEESEAIEAPYQRIDLGFKLSRELSGWRGQFGYQRRRLDGEMPVSYSITDSSWDFRLQHRFHARLAGHAAWKEQRLRYRIRHTEPDVSWDGQPAQESESIREWRFTAEIHGLGLWNPFVAYEHTSHEGNQVGILRLGVMGGVRLRREWTLQIYAFTRNRPRQEIVTSGDQTQTEFLPERQQTSCIISLRRKLSRAGGMEIRWRWSQDQGADSQTYAKHVFSLAYTYRIG